MSVNCSEYIQSEEYMDFIIRKEYENDVWVKNSIFTEEEAASDNGCVIEVNDRWSIGYGRLPKGVELNISELKYHTIPKLYMPLESSLEGALDAAGISQVLANTRLGATGRDVIIGIIDTGIDTTREEFITPSGESRIGIIWDQTAEKVVSEESMSVPYGRVYVEGSYDELEAHQLIPDHGTYIAAIAATAAPGCELAVVKLKPAKRYLREYYLIKEEYELYEETDIMLGVRLLLDYSKEMGKPLVILISMGSWCGPRTGATPLGILLSECCLMKNVAVVAAVGNEANARGHGTGIISDNTVDTSAEEAYKNRGQIELSIGEGEKGVYIEIWGKTYDVISASVTSPTGESIPRFSARDSANYTYDFVLEDTKMTVNYQVVEELSGIELIVIRLINPSPGRWVINLYSLTNIQGEYNIWLPFRELRSDETYLIRSEPDITLTEPSCEARVISVGDYDYITGGIDINSGRGYSLIGAVKPELVAPGVNIHAAGVTRSGSSIAAAFVAAMAAILLDWGITRGKDITMGNNKIKSILVTSAGRRVNSDSIEADYPNTVMGYGRVNLWEGFVQLRNN